jgi:hypothetical protein
MGKFQTQKLTRAIVLKDADTCGQFCKILSAAHRPQMSKAKKVEIFTILEFFYSKVEVQKLNICACLTRLIIPDEEKLTLVRSLTRKFDQKQPLLAKK